MTLPSRPLSPLRASVALVVCALSLAVLSACAHAVAKADAPAPTATAPSAPATPAPLAPAAPDEISGCATANDCTFTRVAVGACCPFMCTPRVVTKARALELDKNIAVCNGGNECPQPPCRAPVADFRIACEQQKCVMKITPITNVVQ
jgi:hypothetical protein